MDFFYNKEIEVYVYGEADDSDGVSREGYTKVITTNSIMVDIQAYTSEKAKKDYGYSLDVSDIMFCDIISEIQEDSIIKYKNQTFSVQKIIEWDDYLDVLLLQTEVTI